MMTLGSLFDGSGGFPLAGAINGIRPLWASEIEPYPIRVTKARFPQMKHLGSVLDINGGEIAPVDIITFGSPCQDLSVAGKQKGIHEGERSSLFFEAIRIIKEMRHATADKYPRFAVWENVPGAFSSNKGADFQAVLQAFCEIRGGHNHIVPQPPKGKWRHAGCIVGDGFSVAWRLYDAQYWGVPQRRKRIYLIADFASERAGEILFERESMPRDPESCKEAGKGTSDNAAGSTGGSDLTVYDTTQVTSPLNYSNPKPGDACHPLASQQHLPLMVATGFKANQGPKAGGIGWQDGLACTINADCPGLEPTVCHAAGFSDALGERAQGGMGWFENGSPSLRAGDVRSVVYDARGNGGGYTVPTLTGDHQNRVTDYTALAIMATGQANAEILRGGVYDVELQS